VKALPVRAVGTEGTRCGPGRCVLVRETRTPSEGARTPSNDACRLGGGGWKRCGFRCMAASDVSVDPSGDQRRRQGPDDRVPEKALVTRFKSPDSFVVSEFGKPVVITCDRTSAADGTTIVCRGGCGRPQMSVARTVPRVYHSGDVTTGPCTQNRSPQSSNLHGFARYVSQRASDSSETGQRGERPAH
jgi:hypothetical protein